MAISFRKTLYSITIVMAVVLGAVTMLGVKQYFLYKHYDEVINRSEQLCFRFSSIKEHITESLLTGKHFNIEEIITDIQGLNSSISSILDDILIPDEYKLAFISHVDLGGIILQLRKIRDDTGGMRQDDIGKLAVDLRLIAERLQRFHQVITKHAQMQLVGFQRIVVGSLALVIFAVSTLLFLWNRRFAIPLFRLVRQASAAASGMITEIVVPDTSREISGLAATFNEILDERNQCLGQQARVQRILIAQEKINRAVAVSRDEKDFLVRACRALLSNSDYCLVWVGIPDKERDDVVPIAADGYTTMDNNQCQQCMAVLLTSSEEKGAAYNPALQALKRGEPVVMRDILADTPTGPIKDTPLASGYASCAAIPIPAPTPLLYGHRREIFGVINIYSVEEECFSQVEIEQLTVIAWRVACVLTLFRLRNWLDRCRRVTEHASYLFSFFSVTLDAECRIIEWDRAFEKITGLSGQDLRGGKLTYLFPSLGEALCDKSSEVIRSRESTSGELEFEHSDGTIHRIRYAMCPALGEQDNSLAIVSGIDITDDEQKQASFQKIEAQRRLLFELVDGLVFLIDSHGRILDANHQVAEQAGVPFEQLCGMDLDQLFQSGEGKGFRQLLEHFSEEEYTGIHSLKGTDYLFKIRPLSSLSDDQQEGCVMGTFLAIATDLSPEYARKEAVIRSSRLASMGELAAGVAHEINNLINGTMNYAQVLLDQAKDEGRDESEIILLDRIITEGERIGSVVSQLLGFMRDSGKTENINISQAVNDCLSLIGHQLRSDGIKISIDIPDDLPPVMASSQPIQQILLNVLSNARYALNRRYEGADVHKKLEIKGRCLHDERGDVVELDITDYGCGIPDDVLPHIFEPFFTTKEEGEGTGLGLSISKELAEDNGGSLTVCSRENEFTTVTITLPAAVPDSVHP